MKKRRILILFAAVVLSAGFFLYDRLRSVRAPEFVLSYAENQTEDLSDNTWGKKVCRAGGEGEQRKNKDFSSGRGGTWCRERCDRTDAVWRH